MMISTKGRYALRLMLDIAMHNDEGLVPIKDIAARQDISMKYLEQIVNTLTRGGLLKSHRGARGGYTLSRKPSEYSVGDILRLTEGALAPVACLEDCENECERAEDCITLAFWEGLYTLIGDYVDSITLEDIIKGRVKKKRRKSVK